jgi:hypothetical protein
MKFAPLLLALLLGACATPQHGSSSDRIDGVVTSVVDDQQVPVAQASVTLSIPGSAELVGVVVTTVSGAFFIDRLSNRVTREEVRLVQHQEYEVEVRAVGYLPVTELVVFEHGAAEWTFEMVPSEGLDCEG